MSTISASTTSSTAYKVTADTTGALVLQTGATPTTAMTIDTSQNTTLAGTLTIGSATQAVPSGTAPLYMARAWVNFNGTGTVAIRGSGNVSSITDNGTGDYTVNFTTAMPDANYSLAGMAGVNTTSMRVVVQPFNFSPPTTTSVRIQAPSADGSLVTDSNYVSVTVIR